MGPMAGGKSTIIHTAAFLLGAALGTKMHDEAVLSSEDLANAHVVFEDFDRLEVREGSLWWRGARHPLNAELKIGNFSVWHVTESHFAVYGQVRGCREEPIIGRPTLNYSFEELKVRCHAAAEAASHVWRIYYDEVELDDKWIPLTRLSYGERRAIVIYAALELGDYILIENLEAGLHVDMLRDIIDAMATSKGKVIAETHSGLVLKLAITRRFKAYYVDKHVKPIEKLDIDMFKKEAMVYSSLI